MADPISIIGTVGSLANIIDTISKTISAARKLQSEWKEADLTFLSLVAQLTALRAALAKIKDWMDQDLDENTHYQLVVDLDISMSCCQNLISKIDTLMSELHQTPDQTLDFSSKVKLIFGNKNIHNVQKLIKQQTGALTLLLTACNW
jgi:hypothetical protein